MARNVAAQRGRKAAHRKQVLAERRKGEGGRAPQAEQIARAAGSPFYACLMPENLDVGMGTVVVARGYGSYVTAVVFLVDTLALGVKDVYVRRHEGSELDDVIVQMNDIAPMVTAPPAEVRKFLHDLVAWARSIGFQPHKDYEILERIFGDVDPAASDATFAFGQGATLISGPYDTEAELSDRAEQVAEHAAHVKLPAPDDPH